MTQQPERGSRRDALTALLGLGYLAPRQSMRALLAMAPGEGERLLMIALAIILRAMSFAFTGGPAAPDGVDAPQGGFAVGLILVAVLGLIEYVILWFLVLNLGRLFGGTADGDAARSAVAWWVLVTAPLQALQGIALSSMGRESGLFALFFVATGALMTWLLAAYVAEAHGFRRTVLVFGAMIGAGLLIALALAPMFAGMLPG